MSEVKTESITVVFNLEVGLYEDLLAHARVLGWSADGFVEALVDLYSKQLIRDMLEIR